MGNLRIILTFCPQHLVLDSYLQLYLLKSTLELWNSQENILRWTLFFHLQSIFTHLILFNDTLFPLFQCIFQISWKNWNLQRKIPKFKSSRSLPKLVSPRSAKSNLILLKILLHMPTTLLPNETAIPEKGKNFSWILSEQLFQKRTLENKVCMLETFPFL